MSELETIARPYAQAIFDFAFISKSIEKWKSMLIFSAKISQNSQIIKLLENRTIRINDLSEIFISICGNKLDYFGKNLIRVMSKYNRLSLLPYVLKIFILLQEEKEHIVHVNLISFNPLKNIQKNKISIALKQRLSPSKVKFFYKIDKSILSGIIIRIGDIVIIDGSVRSRLNRFTHNILQP